MLFTDPCINAYEISCSRSNNFRLGTAQLQCLSNLKMYLIKVALPKSSADSDMNLKIPHKGSFLLRNFPWKGLMA